MLSKTSGFTGTWLVTSRSVLPSPRRCLHGSKCRRSLLALGHAKLRENSGVFAAPWKESCKIMMKGLKVWLALPVCVCVCTRQGPGCCWERSVMTWTAAWLVISCSSRGSSISPHLGALTNCHQCLPLLINSYVSCLSGSPDEGPGCKKHS